MKIKAKKSGEESHGLMLLESNSSSVGGNLVGSGESSPFPADKYAKTRSDSIDIAYFDEEEGISAPDVKVSTFRYSHGLTTSEADALLLKFGKNELPEKTIPKWYIFVSQLWQPMPIMIWIAAIVEAGIENWIDMAILLFIQFANASIGYYEITKAGDAVAALKKSLKPVATVKRDGTLSQFPIVPFAHQIPNRQIQEH
jgi:magnesium-transporting ATPase (P-type)